MAAAVVLLQLAGVPNFGKVTGDLYRGGRPSAEGFACLKSIGITIDVNLEDGGRAKAEEAEAKKAGLCYVSLPWGALSGPNGALVVEFLKVVWTHPGAKIFVHCYHGKDRTGIMVAEYRIREQGWSVEKAIREMKCYGFHEFWYLPWEDWLKAQPTPVPR